MLIAVDIGNSSINIGYFAGAEPVVQKIGVRSVTGEAQYAALFSDFMDRHGLEKKGISCIISSVVPSLTGVVEKGLAQSCDEETADILIVDHGLHTGLEFDVEAPGEIGTDRIANAVAACSLYSPPVAVVDFGTATTVTVVDLELRYIGGAIMPGLGLMNDTLEERTSKLKKVVLEAPSRALGVNTEGCIRTGLFFGTAGGVERILAEIESETGCALTVVMTGGYCPAIEKFIKRPHHVNSYLTLYGLRILHEKNKRMIC